MRRLTILALVVISLSGCATHEKFRAKMNGFIDRPEMTVIAAYGVPQATYAMADGTRAIQFRRGGQMILPGATTYQPVQTSTTGSAQIARGISQPYQATYQERSTSYVPIKQADTAIDLWCSVTFFVGKDGLVKSWASEGNRCVSDG